MGASRREQPRPWVMLIAGIPVRRENALVLVRLLERAGAFEAAQRIYKAHATNERDVALRITDRDAVLRVLAECPDGLLELRITLLQEAVWRKAEGL